MFCAILPHFREALEFRIFGEGKVEKQTWYFVFVIALISSFYCTLASLRLIGGLPVRTVALSVNPSGFSPFSRKFAGAQKTRIVFI
jgi:hypothetical protein